MAKHHNLKQLALAPQCCPALLVCCKPLTLGLQDPGSSPRTSWQPGSPQPAGPGGTASSHWTRRRLPSYCGGWYGFPQLQKLLITALGSSTRAFHSCSPCGLLQHGFSGGTDGTLRRKLLYFCIIDFYLFISLFVSPPPFFFKVGI